MNKLKKHIKFDLQCSDNSAGDSSAGVSCGEGVGVAAFAEIVAVRVDDDGAADDVCGSRQTDEAVLNWDVSDSFAFGKDVAEVADVPVSTIGASVVFLLNT